MKRISKKRKQNLIILLICLIIPILGFLSNEDFIEQDKYELTYLVPFAAGLIYVLWNVFMWISNIKSKTKYWWILLAYFVFIGLFALMAFSLGFEFSARQIGRGSFTIFLIFLIQYAMKAQEDIASLRLEKEQYKTEEYKAQLSLLQAKIDPHFLFNSLNTLQSMVSYGHKNSVSFIINLSNFYRQNMNYIQDASMSVAEEVKVLNSYLFLMKCRYENAVKIEVDIDDSALMRFLPAMTLQVIVENCFKHNRMTTDSPLYIRIGNTDDNYIFIRNNLQMKIEKPESEGYGLSSLKKRYSLLNVSDGVLVSESESFFEVKIKII